MRARHEHNAERPETAYVTHHAAVAAFASVQLEQAVNAPNRSSSTRKSNQASD
jgi:hypothetical protein